MCIHTVGIQVQHSFHVFCLYVSYMLENIQRSLTRKLTQAILNLIIMNCVQASYSFVLVSE